MVLQSFSLGFELYLAESFCLNVIDPHVDHPVQYRRLRKCPFKPAVRCLDSDQVLSRNCAQWLIRMYQLKRYDIPGDHWQRHEGLYEACQLRHARIILWVMHRLSSQRVKGLFSGYSVA